MARSVCCSVGAAGGGGGGGSGSLQPKLKQNILQDQAEALAGLLLSLGIEVHALLQHSHYCHLIGIQSIPGLGLYCQCCLVVQSKRSTFYADIATRCIEQLA